MNVHAEISRGAALTRRPPTRQRRRFTIDEVLAMETAGILREDEQVELIDGDLISMPPKCNRHEDMRTMLAEALSDQSGGVLRVAQEPAFHLSEYFNPEPDIQVFPRALRVYEVHGDKALLVIEVAVSNLSTDLKTKAAIYAAHGVRDYWVVDAKRLVVHVHRQPGADGYGSVREATASETLTPLLAPAVRIRLADLGLEPMQDDDEGPDAGAAGGAQNQH